jgi:hypothetical protein
MQKAKGSAYDTAEYDLVYLHINLLSLRAPGSCRKVIASVINSEAASTFLRWSSDFTSCCFCVTSTPLFHQRRCPLADFLKRHFEAAKLLRTQFREYRPHLPSMLSEGWNNDVFAARGEGDDPDAPVFGALNPADQAFLDEAVHSGTDRTRGQIDNRAYRVDGQWPFMEQDFQHAEIRKAESSLFNTSGCVPCQGAHRLHHYEPDVLRLLNMLGHKKT